jgi:hypothetical protein
LVPNFSLIQISGWVFFGSIRIVETGYDGQDLHGGQVFDIYMTLEELTLVYKGLIIR